MSEAKKAAALPFKWGDVVQLKSGGPPMTVTAMRLDMGREGVATCLWQTHDYVLHYIDLAPSMIMHYRLP